MKKNKNSWETNENVQQKQKKTQKNLSNNHHNNNCCLTLKFKYFFISFHLLPGKMANKVSKNEWSKNTYNNGVYKAVRFFLMVAKCVAIN